MNCPICLETLTSTTTISTTCGHVFHENCLTQWFRTSGDRKCPNCKTTQQNEPEPSSSSSSSSSSAFQSSQHQVFIVDDSDDDDAWFDRMLQQLTNLDDYRPSRPHPPPPSRIPQVGSRRRQTNRRCSSTHRICRGTIQATGRSCTYKARPRSNFCGMHLVSKRKKKRKR